MTKTNVSFTSLLKSLVAKMERRIKRFLNEENIFPIYLQEFLQEEERKISSSLSNTIIVRERASMPVKKTVRSSLFGVT